MTPATSTGIILVADDDPDLRDILRSILEMAGYTVQEAADGKQALESIRSNTPVLAILDYMMPELTGPQICEKLRQDTFLQHLPVIMLTGKSELQDKVQGINAGADDYLTKPFEPEELLARVKMVLRRTTVELEANPLTKLPGNPSIQRELERRLGAKETFSVCYIDLNRFKAFNDHYGFKQGDEVIRQTAAILLEASRAHGSPEDFVGHIGGDDFLIITHSPSDSLCDTIIRKFEALIPTLHSKEDVKRGYLLHTDRKGQQVRLPLLSVSITVVTSSPQSPKTPEQIARMSAELKTYAKTFERSICVKERRS
ncbi:MAG: response regulator [Candidatus Omnitrophica bacterium]|nr:response regulator [Candidatus Omnitrophota bacterium]MBI2174521.1 response regulator [Candidatus Omnitrophota bacterium]MBI3009432.1 response regulator [Candidatus Omnitrophota bacterium]